MQTNNDRKFKVHLHSLVNTTHLVNIRVFLLSLHTHNYGVISYVVLTKDVDGNQKIKINKIKIKLK